MTIKQQGELAELAFLYRAAAHGPIVSKPYGDSAAYDFITDASGFIRRVQVRSVSARNGNDYHLNTAHGRRCKHSYSAREIDLLAAYVIPCDAWYLIPVAALAGRKTIHLRPHRLPRDGFERFREAWHLLAPPCTKSDSRGGSRPPLPHNGPAK